MSRKQPQGLADGPEPPRAPSVLVVRVETIDLRDVGSVIPSKAGQPRKLLRAARGKRRVRAGEGRGGA